MKVIREFVSQRYIETNQPLLAGPLLVVAHMRIPAKKTWNDVKRRSAHHLPHAVKPDGDNLEKFLNDSLNGVVWKDDSQISWLLRSKTQTYSKTGSTRLFVIELPCDFTNPQDIIPLIQDNLNYKEEHGKTY